MGWKGNRFNMLLFRKWSIAAATLVVCIGSALPVAGEDAGNAEFDAAAADLEMLVVHAQQYGDSLEKRDVRRMARAEIFSRGTNALEFLVQNYHLGNFYVSLLADELIRRHLDDALAAQVLLNALDSEHDTTRRFAAYYLGFCNTPEHADAVLSLLPDEAAGGAAARTLGKWAVTNAVPGIVPLLAHERERRRLVAVRALADIGDPAAIPDLMMCLDDPVFTVRKSAGQALARLGDRAVAEVLKGLPEASPRAIREMIGVLVSLEYAPATNALSELAVHPDARVRRDADHALQTLCGDAK